MMMNSYRQNRHRAILGPAAGVLIVIALLFGVDFLTDGGIRAYARTVGAGFSSMFDDGIHAITQEGFFATRAQLRAENALLREELSLAHEMRASYQLLTKENVTLKEMARLAADEQGLSVPVLSSFRSSPYGTFIIGAGEDSGVSPGSIVLTPGGFVLGVVTDSGDHASTVQAIFSPDAEFEAVVGSAAFMLKGRGGGNARGLVSRDVPVQIGQAITAPAYASRPIGIIGSIDAASSSAVSTLHIRIPVNLATLSYVHVIPNR